MRSNCAAGRFALPFLRNLGPDITIPNTDFDCACAYCSSRNAFCDTLPLPAALVRRKKNISAN
jgi:hypothetical protein